ncbi:MAG: hypothetical protein JWP64_3634 [Pseudonocardia sp.]|jgi:hypothetical protein|uniref:SseB family protein n=1 Tax=Pseudonocardia sp. TaxID=60912 RepID=UPI00262504AF|nr:SseB family protein [Pseudonocardia sp.]MCU1628685.1 hypothetical protein [Pseudonocardia sp.]MDT7702561.1 hypothetical protein [Pseudonocardiales bacterium]
MTSTPDDAATDETAAGPDPDTAALLRDLATSIALLPQVPTSEGEERPEGAIALPVIEQDGQRYIPVFTTEAALRSAGADVDSALRIPLAQLAANWPSDDMWLAVNPASEDGLGLPPDVVRALPVFAGSPDGAGESPPG